MQTKKPSFLFYGVLLAILALAGIGKIDLIGRKSPYSLLTAQVVDLDTSGAEDINIGAPPSSSTDLTARKWEIGTAKIIKWEWQDLEEGKRFDVVLEPVTAEEAEVIVVIEEKKKDDFPIIEDKLPIIIDDTKNDFPIIEDKLPIIINDLNDKAEELIKEICKEEKSFLNVISGGLLGISKCVIKDTPETIEKEKQLEKILEERQDKLIDLIKTDPEKISEITNLEKEREKLPDNLKDLIEKEVKINGVLEIVGEKFSIIRTDTPAGKKRIWIYFTISPKLAPGSKIEVVGKEIGGNIIVSAYKIITGPEPETPQIIGLAPFGEVLAGTETLIRCENIGEVTDIVNIYLVKVGRDYKNSIKTLLYFEIYNSGEALLDKAVWNKIDKIESGENYYLAVECAPSVACEGSFYFFTIKPALQTILSTKAIFTKTKEEHRFIAVNLPAIKGFDLEEIKAAQKNPELEKNLKGFDIGFGPSAVLFGFGEYESDGSVLFGGHCGPEVLGFQSYAPKLCPWSKCISTDYSTDEITNNLSMDYAMPIWEEIRKTYACEDKNN